jgi:hypothetical protein
MPLVARRWGKNVPAPLAMELPARTCIMKITKRTQRKSYGTYSHAMASRNFGGFFACKKNPKVPVSQNLPATGTAAARRNCAGRHGLRREAEAPRRFRAGNGAQRFAGRACGRRRRRPYALPAQSMTRMG